MAEKKVKQIKVTYVKSAISLNKNQTKILKGLGLTKLNQTKILPDNDAIRGSIFHVKHLVSVEEVK